MKEYLTFTIDERNELIAEYKRIAFILPPIEKKRRQMERKKAKALADREKKRKKREEERPLRIKEYERLRNIRRKKERQRVTSKKKLQKEALKKKEAEKRAREREKKRQHDKAKKLAQLEREKRKREKQKQAKSARLKALRDQKRNTYKRKKRAIKRIILNRRLKKNLNKQTYRIGLRPFLDELRWLRFCNKTPEEREAYLALMKERHSSAPREYTKKWLYAIRRRERMRSKLAHKRHVIAERNRMRRIKLLYGSLEAKPYIQRLKVNMRLYNREILQHMNMLVGKNLSGDEEGFFAIYTFLNKKSKRCVLTGKWRDEVIKSYENYVGRKINKAILPDLRPCATHDVYLVRDAKLNESPSTFTRDENGRFVRDTTFDNSDMVILRKDTWYDEELFYVYGYHPIEEKKDFNFIYKQILLKGNTKDPYSTKQVMVHNTKVLIIGDNDFDIIVARSNDIANALYTALQEKYEKNGGKKVFFLGTMGEVTWERFLPEMQEKTGWPTEDCIACDLESF